MGLGGENGPAFTDEEINAIEEHRFRPLDHLYWRSSELDFTDVTALIHSLEARSDDPLLRQDAERVAVTNNESGGTPGDDSDDWPSGHREGHPVSDDDVRDAGSTG